MGTKITTRSCLKFMLVFGQIFGMMPVSGITKDHTHLKFKWSSKRTIYSLILALLTVVNTILYFVYMVCFDKFDIFDWGMIIFVIYNFYAVSILVEFLFLLVAVFTVILFIDLAKEWPALMKKWAQVDEAMLSYGFPLRLRRKLSRVFAITMVASLGTITIVFYTSSGNFYGRFRKFVK